MNKKNWDNISIPWIEDIIFSYNSYAFNRLFPQTTNKLLVFILSLLHILGMSCIMLGILLPSKYLGIYLIYLFYIIFSYKYFNGTCYMQLITNKLSKTNESPLYIKMKTVYIIIIINIMIALIGYLIPNYSFYNLIKYLFF